MKKAPIAFFAYKRPEHTRRSLESLSQNEGAEDSELFIFCDGPKQPEDRESVKQVRELVRSRQWCGKVHIIEREKNLGLAESIISGVTELCERYGLAIVIEDDLVLSTHFLNYMNEALEKYKYDSDVMHIAGYMFPVKAELPESFFLKISTCWGWATWHRAWQSFERDASLLLTKIKQNNLEKEFSLKGAFPYLDLLEKQTKKQINSWAICWYASIFIENGLCLHPGRSLVINTGFDGSGTHCDISSDFDVAVLPNKIITFPKHIEEHPKATEALVKYFENVQSYILTSNQDFLKIVKLPFKKILTSLKFEIRYKLYQGITSLLDFGERIEREKIFLNNACIHPSVKILPNASIENLASNPLLITAGENSVIRGQLLIFAHAGKIEIGKDCYVGENSRIWSSSFIKIGDRVLIAHNVNIHDTNSHSTDSEIRHNHFLEIMSNGHPRVNNVDIDAKAIFIENDVWIGFNSTILKGVKIGRGAIIAASSVVNKDVPEFVIVAGNPARIVRKL